jgi:hypothetical protein
VLTSSLLSLNGCYVWRPAVLDSSHEFLNGQARLTRTNGVATMVRGPRLVGDSIVATATRTVTPVAVPRADVRRIDVRRLSRGRTAAVGAVLLAAYWLAAWGFSDSSVDTP